MAAKPSRFWTKKTRDVKLDLLFRIAASVVSEKPLWFDQMFDLFQLTVFLTHLWKTGWFRGHKKPTGGCSNYTAGTVPCLPGMKMNSEIIYEQMNKWDSLVYLVPHPLFCEVIAAYSVQWFRIRKSIKHSHFVTWICMFFVVVFWQIFIVTGSQRKNFEHFLLAVVIHLWKAMQETTVCLRLHHSSETRRVSKLLFRFPSPLSQTINEQRAVSLLFWFHTNSEVILPIRNVLLPLILPLIPY